jgi:hypothetical protein
MLILKSKRDMEAPHLEIREADKHVFELYKDGVPSGRVYNFMEEDELEISDEFFDLTVKGMPVDRQVKCSPLFNGKTQWMSSIKAIWDGQYLTIVFHCHFEDVSPKNTAYVLNGLVVGLKVKEDAPAYGFNVLEPGILDSCTELEKRFSPKGNLRTKIETGVRILEDIRINAEKAVLEEIAKGNLFIDIPEEKEEDTAEEE